MRYYEIDRKMIKDERLIKFLEDYNMVKQFGTREDKDMFSGAYKSVVCKLRELNEVKNVLSLMIREDKHTKEKIVVVILFEYKLPDYHWNAWGEVKFDEEKGKAYFEV